MKRTVDIKGISAYANKIDSGKIDEKYLCQMIEQYVAAFEAENGAIKKALLLPPDITRNQSFAGVITRLVWEMYSEKWDIDIMPALGTHVPMTEEECCAFFGPNVPYSKLIEHDWKNDVCKLGIVPGEYVSEISEGLIDEDIDVEVNRRLVSGEYDFIFSIGQVVPHEVVGMANYSKNVFVGCGGSSMINHSHMLGAFYGLERIMGRDFSPVRKVFDYAEEHYIQDIPLAYMLTVVADGELKGCFVGRQRALFEEAVALSQSCNLNFLDEPIKKAVVYMDPQEFRSTWLANKAVYRTRMALADDAELLVLAPGVVHFGEDAENDRLIRKYGYVGRKKVLELVKEHEDLQQNLSVAAHLIHGSSDDRFNITYAVSKLTREEIEQVAFEYASYDEMAAIYNPDVLVDGYNDVTLPDGSVEKIYYISNPALGLWSVKGALG